MYRMMASVLSSGMDVLEVATGKQFMKQMKNFPSVLRTQYAISLLYENNKIKAKQHIDHFNRIAKIYPYQGDIQSELELIKIVELKGGL